MRAARQNGAGKCWVARLVVGKGGLRKLIFFFFFFFAEFLGALKSPELQDKACVCVAGVYRAASLSAQWASCLGFANTEESFFLLSPLKHV